MAQARRKNEKGLILLAGASGYVGGRLLQALEEGGRPVRCLARRPEYLRPRVGPRTEVVQGDVLEGETLGPVLTGVETAYYLVHSMGASGSFEEQDRAAAENFGRAAAAAGIGRIVYLGGLGHDAEGLSPHLRSRQEVGRVLRDSGVEVIEFRASIVIGSGSLSFELIRALVERLPLMVTPKWVSLEAQPIAIEDLVGYLVAALECDPGENRVFEIGGADRVSYADIMRCYARCRNLPLRMLRVPFLSPWLSSLWLGLVTPVYARIGRKLIESIVHPTVVRDDGALRFFALRPLGIEAAVRRALAAEDEEMARTRWSDALSSAANQRSWAGVRFGTRLADSRLVKVNRPAEDVFAAVERIGGDTGWYGWNWLWQVRGLLDLLVGGVGMRRGRRDPVRLRPGDTLDFWRVEALEPGHRLRLAAEMKLPGRAWLEFEVNAVDGGALIRQTAVFDPVGLWGQLYWYCLYPLHELVFSGMLKGMARAAQGAGGHRDIKGE